MLRSELATEADADMARWIVSTAMLPKKDSTAEVPQDSEKMERRPAPFSP